MFAQLGWAVRRRGCGADTLKYSACVRPSRTDFFGLLREEIWTPTAEWGRNWGAHIREIGSVSGCLSPRAPNWIDRWDFNRSTCWNDERSALASVPEASLPHFRLFCYRLLPVLFGVSGEPESVSIDDLFPDGLADLPSEPDLSNYQSLGYDIVEAHPLASSILGFGCSPLSCNGMAEEITVNRYCLLDDLDNAFTIAKRFGAEQPEPGPYVVMEVLNRSVAAEITARTPRDI